MSLTSKINELSTTINSLLKEKDMHVSTAESCTGGIISSSITSISGSSTVFDRGFVTYSNESKMELLNVNLKTLQEHGAVSVEVAKEMAEGAIANSYAELGISTTGIAGPTGGTDKKPVGTIIIGLSFKRGKTTAETHHFEGTREEIRQQAVIEALNKAIIVLKAH